MPFVVETGTGSATATAYCTLAFFQELMEVEGLGIVLYNDTVQQNAIQRATRYLDTRFTFVGYRKLTTQALDWPRSEAYYSDGRIADNVPIEVQEACAFYAYRSLGARLAPDPTFDDRGGHVVRKVERVGPLVEETEYGQSGVQQTFRKYPEADRRIKELVIRGSRLMRA